LRVSSEAENAEPQLQNKRGVNIYLRPKEEEKYPMKKIFVKPELEHISLRLDKNIASRALCPDCQKWAEGKCECPPGTEMCPDTQGSEDCFCCMCTCPAGDSPTDFGD
jgi:hypothetical protein